MLPVVAFNDACFDTGLYAQSPARSDVDTIEECAFDRLLDCPRDLETDAVLFVTTRIMLTYGQRAEAVSQKGFAFGRKPLHDARCVSKKRVTSP